MEKRLLKDETGFTLIELMVVVAIIGVLSAIAVPNFKKYQAKAKQSEAKIQLAAVYASEVGAMADYDAFATCLLGIGYEWPQRGYYIIGFDASETLAITADGRMSDANCNDDDIAVGPDANTTKGGGHFLAPVVQLKSGNPVATVAANLNGTDSAWPAGQMPAPFIEPEADAFTASAAGNIASTLVDVWSIDTTKKLTNQHVGY